MALEPIDALCRALGAVWMVVDRELRVVDISATVRSLLGLEPQAVIGLPCFAAVRCGVCLAGCPAAQTAPYEDTVVVHGSAGPRWVHRVVLPWAAEGQRLELLAPIDPPAEASPAPLEVAGCFATADPVLARELARATLLVARGALRLVQGPCPIEREALVHGVVEHARGGATLHVTTAARMLARLRCCPDALVGEGDLLYADGIELLAPDEQLALCRGLRSAPLRVEVIYGMGCPSQDCSRQADLHPLLVAQLRPGQVLLPALSERPDDVILRTRELLGEVPFSRVTPEVVDVLRRWPWRGGVGELEAVVATLVALAAGGRIGPEHLPPDLQRPPEAGSAPAADSSARLQRAIERAGGNLSEAARELGVSRATLWRWRKRHGLT